MVERCQAADGAATLESSGPKSLSALLRRAMIVLAFVLLREAKMSLYTQKMGQITCHHKLQREVGITEVLCLRVFIAIAYDVEPHQRVEGLCPKV